VNWRKKGRRWYVTIAASAAAQLLSSMGTGRLAPHFHSTSAVLCTRQAGQRANALSTGEPTPQPSGAWQGLALLYTPLSRAACGWFSLGGRKKTHLLLPAT